MSLIGDVLKLLAKSGLIPLGLTAAASATDAAIYKEMFGSGMTTLIVSNEEMNDIMKIVKSLEKSGLLIKDIYETIKNEAKNKKADFSIYYYNLRKIFETNSSFHVKQRITGKVQFLFFSSFLLVLTKSSFWEEDWALGYNSMKF